MKSLAFVISFLLLGPSAFAQEDAIHKAAYHGELQKVRDLLQKGANPDARDSFGGTALHAAMFQKNMEVVKVLLEHGCDLNAQGTGNGYTPLHDAVWADNGEAVNLLLDKGAKTNLKGKDGLTPYAKAQKEGRTKILRILESRGIKE
jgi:ankyrin repeat protein